MPYSEGSSGDLASPKLISNIENFRFASKPKFSTNSTKIDEFRSNRECTPEEFIIDIVIPETPESQLNVSSSTGSPGLRRAATNFLRNSQESQDSPIYPRKLSTSKHNHSFSSDSSTPAVTSKTIPRRIEMNVESNVDDYDVFCDKERCLRNLLASCPLADIMEAQDILVSCKWNLEQAIEKTRSLPPKVKKKVNSERSHKGAVYNDDVSIQNISSSAASIPQVDEIVLDSDNDTDSSLGLSVAVVETVSHNGTSGGPLSSPPVTSTLDNEFQVKKRRRIQCLDDDSDSQTSPALSNHKSEFSVLDFKPNSSNSSNSLGKPLRSFTYSKTIPTQHQRYNHDASVFTNDHAGPHIVSKSRSRQRNAPKMKGGKKRRKKFDHADDDDDEDYGNEVLYDSEDSDVDESLTPARNRVLTFFQDASEEELSAVPGCSKKKVEALMKYRPFVSWADLVQKLDVEKGLSTELLNGAKKILDMRVAVTRLMNKCTKIALQMEDLVEALKENKEDSKDYVSRQPNLLNADMHLTPYQMLGLNWLLLMHNQEVNGILADEMGLGKTIQAIAFLSYLKEQAIPGPHLIVVPSSTLDNWQNELQVWWPTASVLCYHGSQESRRELRMQIINDEVEDFDIMVSTYNMVTSSPEDRGFFKRLEFHYVIFDEAHMLKNMASQRYQNLMRVKASRRLLLTGTPLQNNLVELMSLLIFAMPHMFSGKTEQIKLMFSAVCKKDDSKSEFEKDKIEHAKRIMKPFVLRRLKSEVLKDLPTKHEEIRHCPLSKSQSDLYVRTVHDLSEEVRLNKEKEINTSGMGMMMQLRKAANHPLLMRSRFPDELLLNMSKLIIKEPTHCDANPTYVYEDMCVMSDFELHRMCKQYKTMQSFCLSEETVLDSGKFQVLSSLLPDMINQGHRILLFSQFTMMLDVIEEYMKIKNYKYLRLDGQIPVHDRQILIDEFNRNPEIPVFLLSTRAGGLGINLTSADTVIIHDIDFNPYNDKQAEDRCHRVGQTRDVIVMRLISKDTIEEGILKRAQDKLRLERDVTCADNDDDADCVSVATLLTDALGISIGKS